MKIIISVVVLVSLACGMQAALPTSEPVSIPYEVTETKELRRTSANFGEHTEVELHCGPTITPDFSSVKLGRTTGQLNVRQCPSTSSAILGVLETGTSVEIGAEVLSQDTGYRCPRWYPIVWQGQDGWICSGWVE